MQECAKSISALKCLHSQFSLLAAEIHLRIFQPACFDLSKCKMFLVFQSVFTKYSLSKDSMIEPFLFLPRLAIHPASTHAHRSSHLPGDDGHCAWRDSAEQCHQHGDCEFHAAEFVGFGGHVFTQNG